jgi:hypothetical protein
MSKSVANKSLRFNVTYLDQHKNQRNFYITAASERDALVDSWLNNKNIIDVVSVKLCK